MKCAGSARGWTSWTGSKSERSEAVATSGTMNMIRTNICRTNMRGTNIRRTHTAQAAQRAAGPTQPLGVLAQSALLCCHRFSIVNRLRQSIYLLLVCKPKSFCMYIYTLVLMIRTNPTPGQLPATRAAAASWVGQRHSCRFGHEQPDLQSWAASL